MKSKNLIYIITIFLLLQIVEINNASAQYFYKHFGGKINNKFDIKMNLVRNDNFLSGTYFYEKVGILIDLSGNIDASNKFLINEFDSNGNLIGSFTGTLKSDTMLIGTWQNKDKTTVYDFEMNEDYAMSQKFTRHQKNIEYHIKNDDSLPSCVVNFDYLKPEFGTSKASKNLLIKDLIEKSFFYKIENNISVETKLDNKVTDYLKMYKEFETDWETAVNDEYYYEEMYQWESSASMNIIFNDYNVLSYQICDYGYEGGAHPNSYTGCVNIDLKIGTEINLTNIFNEGYETTLIPKILSSMMLYFNVTDEEGLNEYLFDMNNITISENFYLTKKGICFVYNEYEIAPYSSGIIMAYIPFKDLSDILRTDFCLK